MKPIEQVRARIRMLLRDPQPGLVTWWEAIEKELAEDERLTRDGALDEATFALRNLLSRESSIDVMVDTNGARMVHVVDALRAVHALRWKPW